MEIIIGMAGMALLFVLFGTIRYRGCTGHCAGCTGACGRNVEENEHVH